MKQPLIWAHRGASGYMPENTLPAFEKAIDLGADGIELDIHKTKDGKIVVIHDEWIDRTSDGRGWVKDLTFDELRQFNYNKTVPECQHADIPTMEEVFELISHTNLTINIELKTGIVFYENIEQEIIDMVAKYGMEDRVIYSSFNHASILKVKELNPGAKTGFLYADGTLNMPAYGHEHGVDALHPALYNIQYPNFIKECRQYGLSINSWTINEPEHLHMACQAGIDAIITNYPDRARQIVECYTWD